MKKSNARAAIAIGRVIAMSWKRKFPLPAIAIFSVQRIKVYKNRGGSSKNRFLGRFLL